MHPSDLAKVLAALLVMASASTCYSRAYATVPSISVLHSFTGVTSDGAYPDGALVIGSGGVLYGATFYGGSGISCGAPGCGTVYSLTPPASPGGAWTGALIHDFAAGGTVQDGNYPIGALAIGTGGVLYGVTYAGGSSSAGSVFSLTPPAIPGQDGDRSVQFSSGQQGGAVPGIRVSYR